MQNIHLRNLCSKNAAWIGIAVVVLTALTDAFCYGSVSKKPSCETAWVDEQVEETETQAEMQTEDIVESLYAGTELDEVHLVMGTINQNENKEEESTEAVVEEEIVPQPVISYSEEDYNNFLRIVEAEATGGDVLSKMIVANVIINRVKHPYFPNTITEVVFQGNGEQFSPVADGRFYTVTVTDSTIEAVNRALMGEDYSQGALFFAAVYCVTPDCWHINNLTRLFEYGGHIYFTF